MDFYTLFQAMKAKFFGPDTVSGILKDFHQTVTRLDNLRTVKMSEAADLTRAAERLADEAAASRAEAALAGSVANKLEALLS